LFCPALEAPAPTRAMMSALPAALARRVRPPKSCAWCRHSCASPNSHRDVASSANCFHFCSDCTTKMPHMLDEHSRPQHHRLGTPRPLILDLSNAISKPTCSHTPSWRHQHLYIPYGRHGAIQMLYYYYYYYLSSSQLSQLVGSLV